jgi:hypothetical protein
LGLFRPKTFDRLDRDQKWSSKCGAPHEDIQNARRIIGQGQGWIDQAPPLCARLPPTRNDPTAQKPPSKKFFSKSRMRISAGVGKIDANNWF